MGSSSSSVSNNGAADNNKFYIRTVEVYMVDGVTRVRNHPGGVRFSTIIIGC